MGAKQAKMSGRNGGEGGKPIVVQGHTAVGAANSSGSAGAGAGAGAAAGIQRFASSPAAAHQHQMAAQRAASIAGGRGDRRTVTAHASQSVSQIQRSRSVMPESSSSSSSMRSSTMRSKSIDPLMMPSSFEDDGTLFVALYDYKARTENEMSFAKGDKLRVRANDNPNWWLAESLRTHMEGWVPSNYIAPVKSVEKNVWYHGKIPRSTAEYLLNSGIDGSFLVRESESNPGEHTISLRFDGRCHHYRVGKHGSRVSIMPENPFDSLQDLVQHHSKKADGLIYPLKHAVPKIQAQVYGVSKDVDDRWEISRDEIALGRRLGSGQYGEVYKGEWRKYNKEVAVKTFKEETTDQEEFLKEANVMKKMQHENLVQLLGVCTLSTPLFIITEYMPHGNLLDYLRNEEVQAEVDATALMYCASQVASGMAYLESHGYIHRDLAARNLLVGDNLLIKIADFGLSRLLQMEDIYTAQEGAKFPIKWTAPESLNYNVFTVKSDVWAFGIVLWELATYGKTPYPGMDLFAVLDKLDAGYRMPRPEGCPTETYALMRECWQHRPEDRPSFSQIVTKLESMFGDHSVAEEVEKVLTIEKGMSLEDLGDQFATQPRSTPKPRPRPSAVEESRQAQNDTDGAARGSSSSSATAAAAATSDDAVAVQAVTMRTTTTTAKDSQQSRPLSVAQLKADADEVADVTKRIFRQAQLIARSDDGPNLVAGLELLLTDTQSMLEACALIVRENPTALASLEAVSKRLASTSACGEHIAGSSEISQAQHTALNIEVQELAKAVRELFLEVRALVPR